MRTPGNLQELLSGGRCLMDTFRVRSFPVFLQEHRLLSTDADDAAFGRHARRYAASPESIVLLSGGGLDCSRYSLAAFAPFLTFKSKGHTASIRFCGESLAIRGNPLDILDELFAALQPQYPQPVAPFSGGAMGYFAYDLKNGIERLPETVTDDLHLPEIYLIWPTRILVHDRVQRTLHALTLACEPAPGSSPQADDPSGAGRMGEPEGAMRVGALESNFTHEGYLEAVGKIRRYICEGDVYQVNLSQRFRFPFQGDPYKLWESLFAVNPAPFYAFINAGDHQVLSTSMERFLYRAGSRIETRPIKGTRKRGLSIEEDLALRDELIQSPKDDAELSMIVDLLRNDLGRICRARSIRVEEHKRVEAYQNVYHLVSIVTGRLVPEITPGAILRATFPGGSITGCPKIRAMEIIDELEPHVRHVYTGAIGYLGWHENLDLNIAIRTAIVQGGRCYFSVGGGVVHDSDEEDEYQETLHKGRTLFQLIEKLQTIEEE